MLEFDNLDLDLDEEFSSGPFDQINFLEGILNKSSKKISETSKNTCLTLSNKSIRSNNKENDVLDLIKKGNIFNNSALDKNKTISQSHATLNDLDLRNKSTCILDLNKTGIINNLETSLEKSSERKFPGPAGLLPDKSLEDVSELNMIMDDSSENEPTDKNVEDPVMLCTQCVPILEELTYKKLLLDFKMDDPQCTLSKYTVDWVKKKALKKTLSGKKIPFLALVVQYVDHTMPDPVLTLKDSTGDIYGTVHRDVWNELSDKLQPGSAVVLRQIGVIMTGIARKRIYLSITKSTIVKIYSYADDETVETDEINKVTNQELLKSITNWNSETLEILKPAPTPVQLFSKIGKKSNHLPKQGKPQRNSNMNNKLNKSKTALEQVQNQRTLSKTILKPKSYMVKVNEGAQDDFTALFDVSLDDFDFDAESSKSDVSGNNFGDLCKSKKTVSERLNMFQFEAQEKNKFSYLKANECELSRKRKISSECVDVPDKINNKQFKNDFHGNTEKIPEMSFHRLSMISSQPLSQMESQSVEEVLEGIDLDDF